MRRKIHVTEENMDALGELWEVIKEIFAANEAQYLGGEGKAASLLENSVKEGLITVDAELDDDLSSDDDKVTYTLTKTAKGQKVDQALWAA